MRWKWEKTCKNVNENEREKGSGAKMRRRRFVMDGCNWSLRLTQCVSSAGFALYTHTHTHAQTNTHTFRTSNMLFVGLVNVKAMFYHAVGVCLCAYVYMGACTCVRARVRACVCVRVRTCVSARVSAVASVEPFLTDYCSLMSLQCHTAFGHFGSIEIKCHIGWWVIPGGLGGRGAPEGSNRVSITLISGVSGCTGDETYDGGGTFRVWRPGVFPLRCRLVWR